MKTAEYLEELWHKSGTDAYFKLSIFAHFINSIPKMRITEVSKGVFLCRCDDGSSVEFKCADNKVSCSVVVIK